MKRTIAKMGFVVIVCCLLWLELKSTQGQFLSISLGNPPINFGLMHSGTRRPITLRDIVSTRKVREPQISPDSKKIAFVVRQALLDQNEYRSSLYVVNTDGRSNPVKLLEEQSLTQLRWMPDSQAMTYTSPTNNSLQVWRINVSGGAPTQITRHASGVGRYTLSPDGTRIAFVASKAVGAKELEQLQTQGLIYNPIRSETSTLFGRSWVTEPQQLWLHNLREQTEEKVIQQTSPEHSLFEMVWSQDNRKIAVVVHRPVNPFPDVAPYIYDVGFISLETRQYTPVITWGGYNSSISWSPDSNSLAFVSNGDLKDGILKRNNRIFVINLSLRGGKPIDIMPNGQQSRITIRGWNRDGTKIFFETIGGTRRSISALHEVSIKEGIVRQLSPNGFMSDFSLNKEKSISACIQQSPTTPPEVSVFDVDKRVGRRLTALHPEYDKIILSKPYEQIQKNKYGNEFHSFLVKPLHYVEGNRYPLVVILYRHSGEFFTDVFGNYPIQSFAADGHAVLLVTFLELPYRSGNFKEASMSEMYNPFANIEQAVETAIKTGIADPNRLGIMGWSYGCFLTSFTITQTDLFAAASIGDSSLYNAASYYLENGERQKWYDTVLGGPPYGATYKNWQQVSPDLNADRVRIPVLIEFRDREPSSTNFYTAITKQGGQAELVIYPNAAHVFSDGHPKHSHYSMQRNLDWFNFWLQNKEDPDPSKQEQYARWRAMRYKLNDQKLSQPKR